MQLIWIFLEESSKYEFEIVVIMNFNKNINIQSIQKSLYYYLRNIILINPFKRSFINIYK